MFDTTDTIAAIATPLGESGIGVIRISGPGAYAVGDAIFHSTSSTPLGQRRDRSIQYGTIRDDDGRDVDEVLLLIMKGPHSYTAEDVLEIQCHGGRQALQEILQLVLSHGARMSNPGEFTQRAFANGRLDLAQAEAVMDVIQAKSARGLTSAVSQLEGRLSRVIGTMRKELTDFITRLEVTIDYPEEDLEDITVPDVEGSVWDMIKRLDDMLAQSKSGKLIRAGVMAAIAGTPNAGKSSLLNRLVQEERAIVTDVPGTTRDVIEEWITVVVDGSRPLTAEDVAVLDDARGREAVIALNKIDKGRVVMEGDLADYDLPVYAISAGTGEGMDAFKEYLLTFAGGQSSADVLLTNARHIELVRQSREALQRALQTIEDGMPVDLAVVDLREAWDLLGSITGDSVHTDMVEEIFSRFCLGK